MQNIITIVCLAGLIVFGFLWTKASSKVWYLNSDNEEVSPKAIIGFLWMTCLATLLLQLI